jgi:DNA polymerase-3 subunit epsilon
MTRLVQKVVSRHKAWQFVTHLFGHRPDPDLSQLKYVVLDTETTGFDVKRDRILCIGALKLYRQQILVSEALELYIKQDHYDSGSAEIHGILSKEARPCLHEAQALREFIDYLDEAVIVAHHAAFDMAMINAALERHGLPGIRNRVIDTSSLYRKTLIASPLIIKKERYTLDELADKYDISKKDRHTALGDAYITAIVFLKIVNALKQKGITGLRRALR